MARLLGSVRIATLAFLILVIASPSATLGQQIATCPALLPGFGPRWNLELHPEVGQMAPSIESVIDESIVQYESPRGIVKGFVPGPIYRYPDGPVPFYLFARDTATIVPMARYLEDQLALRSAVEEFLRLQYTDDTVSVDGDLNQPVGAGALSGTISPDFQVNKATITSDEEPSVILTASSYFRAYGDTDWLLTDVEGQTVLQRLNAAMEWLLEHRYEEGVDLIKRGHTTDWGDVKMEVAPQPTDITVFHVWTYSIYDQALTFAALRGLAEMNLAAGDSDLAQRYLRVAETIRASSDARLWMRDRGYYRIHLHAAYTPSPHPFDEDDVVAIGNAAAIYYGLATGDKVGQILETLEAARISAGAPKAGLTLQPEYPNGEFLQIQMAERKYQNGAIWDWWGGRQIVAEYQNGYTRYGDAHLLQTAADWATHPGEIFEWESPWTGEESRDNRYAGAAAVMGEAVVSGLFGISLRDRSLELAPRLGSRGGAVTVTDVPSGTRIAYSYTYDESSRRAEFCYSTAFKGAITLRQLLPPGTRVRSALLDGTSVGFFHQSLNEDQYVVADGPSGVHRLTLDLIPFAN